MSQIIVFRESRRLDAFFSPLDLDFKKEKFEVVLASPKDKGVFITALSNPENLIIVEYNLVQDNPGKLNEVFSGTKASIVIAADFQKVGDAQWGLRELCARNPIIEGVIDTSREVQFAYPLIRSILKRNSLLGHIEDAHQMGENLNKLISMTLSELQRVKKLHEQLVPIRNESFKGLTLSSKFAAGMSNGGEFFDIIKNEQYVLFLLTSSSSYVASSIVLGHFEKLKEMGNLSKEHVEEFFEDLLEECRNYELVDRDQPEKLQLFLVKLDLKDLSFFGYSFGGAQVYSNKELNYSPNNHPFDENFFEKAFFEKKLERNEKILIASPGVKKNLVEEMDGNEIESFLKGKVGGKPREILNEVFFQLKKDSDAEFLKHDASVIVIEVDKNVIVQV